MTLEAVDRARESLSAAPGLALLRQIAISDPSAEDAFSRLTRLAAAYVEAPVGLVSIVDEYRLVFKGRIGMPEPWASLVEAPLTDSFL